MERPQRTTTVIMASLAIVGSLVSLWLMFRPATVQYDQTPIIGAATGIGEVLAEETIKAVNAPGRIVLVTDYYRTRVAGKIDDYAETFSRELKKHGNISIVATEVVRPVPGEGLWISCPIAAFKELLERHAGADAIVFFTDLPQWASVSSLIPATLTAKIIVVDNRNNMQFSAKTRYSGYFAGGILTVLISQKKAGSSQSTAPRTPRDWFDRYYQVYTPQNYETLPD